MVHTCITSIISFPGLLNKENEQISVAINVHYFIFETYLFRKLSNYINIIIKVNQPQCRL